MSKKKQPTVVNHVVGGYTWKPVPAPEFRNLPEPIEIPGETVTAVAPDNGIMVLKIAGHEKPVAFGPRSKAFTSEQIRVMRHLCCQPANS